MSSTVNLRIAFGIEAREKPSKEELVEYIKKLPEVKDKGNYCYEYKRKDVKYDIRLIFTRKDFLEALEQEGAIVVYEGHSRRGQGPAFAEKENVGVCAGNDEFPTDNPWENYVRMGWDIVEIPCVDEILYHGTKPIEYSKKKIPRFTPAKIRFIITKASENEKKRVKCDFHKILKKRRIQSPTTLAADCYPSMAEIVGCRGVTLNGRSYWKSRLRTEDEKAKFRPEIDVEFSTLVEAGSEDLKKSKLRCSALFMKSCSSIQHYYCALRRRRAEIEKESSTRKREKPCVFYLTKIPSHWRANSPLLFAQMILEGKDPTNRKDAKLICQKLNSVNSTVFSLYGVRKASGIVYFSTGQGLQDWEKDCLSTEGNACRAVD